MDLNCHVDKDAEMTYNRVNPISSMFFSVFIIDVTINRQRKERGMDQKRPRKTEERQLEIVRQLRPIDDCFFEVMMEDPDACQELLQVVLENPLLRIKKETVSGQKSIRIIGKSSIRVDAYAEGNEHTVFNIEIQRADNENHVKRVRYNASVITVNRSEPGDLFEQVQELFVIYIADFDVLRNGRTISHAEMTCVETGVALNDGLHEIFVTTIGKDNNKIARLMREYKNPDMNNPEFPKQSKRVQEMKHDSKEAEKMCKLVEDYKLEGIIQGVIEAYVDAGLDEKMILFKLVKKFNLTEEKAQEYYDIFAK